MTLVFVPKIIAMFLALIIALPFMGQVLGNYMIRLAERIAAG
jgi:flagellar biosynthetic protein FliQ